MFSLVHVFHGMPDYVARTSMDYIEMNQVSMKYCTIYLFPSENLWELWMEKFVSVST